MNNILIIEDEKLAADTLWKEIQKISSEYSLSGVIGSVKEGVKQLQKEQPDLLFLDVQLSDGLSFEILEKVEVNCPIIFTTAYDQFALDAFKHNSIHYLLKPVNPEDLENALARFEKSRNDLRVAIDQLLDQVGEKKYQKRFSVQVRKKIHSIQEEEIAYFLGEDKYVYLFNLEGQKFLIDTTLKELETKLDPKKFFRINRKFIIAFDSIREMLAYSKSRVKVELTPEPPNPLDAVVSVERSPQFKNWINR